MKKKEIKRKRLKRKIRVKMNGTSDRPRLSVFRSNKFIYAQIIDDTKGNTLLEASDLKLKKGTKVERAEEVGKMIAEKCKTAKITKVVFDRNGFRYAGRVKLVADSARKSGLKF